MEGWKSFLRLSSNILNTSLETLKIWNISHHSLVYKAKGCVKFSILIIIIMWCIWPILCPNSPWYSSSDLWRLSSPNETANMCSFSDVDSIQNNLSTLQTIPVGGHSLTKCWKDPVTFVIILIFICWEFCSVFLI